MDFGFLNTITGESKNQVEQRVYRVIMFWLPKPSSCVKRYHLFAARRRGWRGIVEGSVFRRTTCVRPSWREGGPIARDAPDIRSSGVRQQRLRGSECG